MAGEAIIVCLNVSLQEECLAESFTRFINHCLSLIRKQRDVFPVNNRQAMLRLDGMLQCLHEIYTMNVFRRTCPFQKELHPEIANVVKVSKVNLELFLQD